MRDAFPTMRALGAAALGVTADPPELARAYAAELGLPFPLVCDERRVAFQAYGLARSLAGALAPRLLPRYAAAALRMGIRRPGRDVLQLGGTFVLDRDGRVALAHPARDPADHPPLSDVLAAMARHHAAVVHGRRTRLRPPQPGEAVPAAEGGLLFVAETEAGPGAALVLSWPGGDVEVLQRGPGHWDDELEADALAALRGYARGELGLGTRPPRGTEGGRG